MSKYKIHSYKHDLNHKLMQEPILKSKDTIFTFK